MNLNNKTILVMGAAGRIGQVVVSETFRSGANVVAVENNSEQLAKLQIIYDACLPNDKKRLLFLDGNITNILSIQAVIAQGIKQFGRLDGAVNTAYPRNDSYGKEFLEVTYKDFAENVSLHLGGYFLFMQQCVKYALTEKSIFSLVNLSSVYGIIPPRFDMYRSTLMTMPIEYAAIKSALQHMVNYVTAYSKGSKFRVNCVSPGGIFAEQDEIFVQRYKSYCREKGLLNAKDIVGTILFLLSDAAEYLCGQNIVIDDAFHS